MDLLTVTCTRDRYAMQLLAHTLNKFVTDTCVHYVVIEDNDTSYAEWLTLLLPYYTTHQLKIVHDYNLSANELSRGGYFRQQQIKLQMSEKIYSNRYLIIDSKTIFFKTQKISDWPVYHGNRSIESTPIQDSRYYGWLIKVCEQYGLPVPDTLPSPMTPFVMHTHIAKQLIKDIDVTKVIWRDPIHDAPTNTDNPSEFILYCLYASQFDPDVISKVHDPVYVFCYTEDTMIKHPPEHVENNFLTFGIDRRMLTPQYFNYLGQYYNWLLAKGINQQLLDQAWFGPLFNSFDIK